VTFVNAGPAGVRRVDPEDDLSDVLTSMAQHQARRLAVWQWLPASNESISELPMESSCAALKVSEGGAA